ncbi:hypothetical protein MCOR27_003182 [Pyricularia oryzae]|nr:hypothetical protein MCOR27_003182 [Pyricularia oryzae]KAI6380515.1 hypothetical protein MCOR32_004018 [Pyricularia oryzae]KAI6433706.1 hypothetical protein MCOR22_009589 [Pyricularia oryzae]
MEDQIFHNFRITHSYSENHDAENTITGEKVSLRLSPEKHRLEAQFLLSTERGYLHDWVFDWTAKRYIGQSSKTATTGEGLVEQPDYGPISQQELQKEVRRLNGSLQGLQDKIEQDYKQNPVAIHPSQFEELLDGYLNVIWALDRLSERQPRPSNDKIAEIMWTIIEQIFGRPEHGMKSDQQSAFFRLAYSTLAVFYVTVPASKTIWALYLKKISERG